MCTRIFWTEIAKTCTLNVAGKAIFFFHHCQMILIWRSEIIHTLLLVRYIYDRRWHRILDQLELSLHQPSCKQVDIDDYLNQILLQTCFEFRKHVDLNWSLTLKDEPVFQISTLTFWIEQITSMKYVAVIIKMLQLSTN